MIRVRTLLLGLVAATAFGVGGVSIAADCGEDGSAPNPSGSCETRDNQVRCGEGYEAGGATFSGGANGGEVCNEDGDLPIQGRAGAEADCFCIYADGDADNESQLLLDGWIRFDPQGATCADRDAPEQGEQSYTGTGQPLQECA